MGKQFTSVVLVASAMLGFAACATGADSNEGTSNAGGGQSTSGSSTSGQGGAGGVTMSSQMSSSSSAGGAGGAGSGPTSVTIGQGGSDGQGGGAGGQDGGPSLCGNGVLDPGEQCDDKDFGGKTCSSIGLDSGELICNKYCGIVASNCIPKESCADGMDNDKDGETDCLDSDCAKAAVCIDSCASPKSVPVPVYLHDDTSYHASSQRGSCTSASGGEVIYRIKAPTTGVMSFELGTYDIANFSLSLRTACGDDASEVACVDDIDPNVSSDPEVLLRDVVQGEVLYVVVDSVAPDSVGSYNLQIDMVLPEGEDFPGSCSDFSDSDNDGRIDCDDPSACQSMPDCVPGMAATGSACSEQTECAANHNDPICLGEKQGYVDGYCSEFCDLTTPDCAGDALCADIGLRSLHGVCLDGCVTDTDCRTGYACVDLGLSGKVCTPPPESTCDDYTDNDQNGFVDCEDRGCAASAACVAGSKATGQPCTAHNECFSDTTDPFCIDLGHYKYPGGYCSEFCDLKNDDCGPGAICTNWIPASESGSGLCFHTCKSTAECRSGYKCLDIGASKKACVH